MWTTPFELVNVDPIKGEAVFRSRCAACHTVGTRVPGGTVGPDLEFVYARKAGALPGFPYSPAIAKLPQEWDFISLNIFMADPQAYAPGTSMAAAAVDDRATRTDIAEFLKKTAGQ